MKSILVRAQIGRKEILVPPTPAPSILPISGTAEHTRKFYRAAMSGSAAAPQHSTIPAAAVECKAEVRADFSSIKI